MIISFDGGGEKPVNLTNMIEIKIELSLVESLVSETSRFTGTVLLCELRDAMQTYIRNGLVRGCKVSLRNSFDYAWAELIVESDLSDSSDSMHLR